MTNGVCTKFHTPYRSS